MPILVDLSGTMYASLHVDISKGNATPNKHYIRHLVFNSLRSYNLTYRDQYGEMIICMDYGSWRKQYFPEYKWLRYNAKDENDKVDWEAIHKMMEELCEDIIEHLPYPVVRVKYAEGDDVIGVLSDRFADEGEKVLIASNDKDMVERTKRKNIEQFRPVMKCMYEVDDPRYHEFELFVRGDKGDGIPNILCPPDFYKTQYEAKMRGEKIRAKAISTKKLLEPLWEIVSNPHTEHDILEFLGKEVYDRYCMNRKLVSLNMIPDVLTTAINDTYDNAKRNGIMKMLTYMNQNNMSLLARELKSFEPKRKNKSKIFG